MFDVPVDTVYLWLGVAAFSVAEPEIDRIDWNVEHGPAWARHSI